MKKDCLTYFIIMLAFIAFSSCLSDDAYDSPPGEPTFLAIPRQHIVTIDALRSAWSQELASTGNATLTFSEDFEDNYVEGYVISSDESGNYFEELILQDQFKNPTAGLKLLIDSNPLDGRYPIGRRLYVALQGMSVGLDSGVLTLGIENGGMLKPIAESWMDKVILRDTLNTIIEPMQLNLSDLTDNKTNVYIRLSDVQFHRNQALGDDPLTYAGEESDQFDGERILESCSEGLSLIFSTSTFANFKLQELARGRGFIDGILSYNYFGDYFVFSVNSLNEVYLNDETRCDPEVFNCEGPGGGTSVFWSENFEEHNSIEAYENAGWTNYNPAGAATKWEMGNFDGNNYLQITGFNSGESSIEGWLITPEISLDGSSDEELFVNVQTSYNNGIALSVAFSSNFFGNIETADWNYLDMVIPNGPANGFGTFQTQGPVNLSCVDGNIHLAFIYRGSDPDLTTRYHIDAIKLTGN